MIAGRVARRASAECEGRCAVGVECGIVNTLQCCSTTNCFCFAMIASTTSLSVYLFPLTRHPVGVLLINTQTRECKRARGSTRERARERVPLFVPLILQIVVIDLGCLAGPSTAAAADSFFGLPTCQLPFGKLSQQVSSVLPCFHRKLSAEPERGTEWNRYAIIAQTGSTTKGANKCFQMENCLQFGNC